MMDDKTPLRWVTQKDLDDIIQKHEKWLKGDINGVKADLSNANFCELTFYGRCLNYANLSGSCFNHADMRRVSLEYANMKNVLIYSDLCGANLNYADLTDANLQNSNLGYSYLRYADLSNSNLSYVNFEYSNLFYADLTKAIVSGTNFNNADLSFAKFNLADLRHSPIFLECVGDYPIYQVSLRLNRNSTLTLCAVGERKDWKWFLGNFAGTKEELLEESKGKYKERILLSIEYLEKQAELNKK